MNEQRKTGGCDEERETKEKKKACSLSLLTKWHSTEILLVIFLVLPQTPTVTATAAPTPPRAMFPFFLRGPKRHGPIRLLSFPWTAQLRSCKLLFLQNDLMDPLRLWPSCLFLNTATPRRSSPRLQGFVLYWITARESIPHTCWPGSPPELPPESPGPPAQLLCTSLPGQNHVPPACVGHAARY